MKSFFYSFLSTALAFYSHVLLNYKILCHWEACVCVEGRVCAHMYISCEIHIDFNVDFCQVTWSDIAGLDDVITDLKDTVILPIKKKHLFENSRLLQPPKGMVVYVFA